MKRQECISFLLFWEPPEKEVCEPDEKINYRIFDLSSYFIPFHLFITKKR
jgi:hypothetical protein